MNKNRLITILVTVTIALIAANIANELLGRPSWQVNQLVNVSYEANIPAWFSSMLLAIAAFFGYKCSLVKNIALREKRTWQLFALGLLGMSCDETAQFHERIGNMLNKYIFKIESIHNAPWVVILGPFILIFLFLFALNLGKYLKGSKKARGFLIAGALIYIGGAFILESTINFMSSKQILQIESIIEESCEMFGMILVIKGLIEHVNFLERQTNG